MTVSQSTRGSRITPQVVIATLEVFVASICIWAGIYELVLAVPVVIFLDQVLITLLFGAGLAVLWDADRRLKREGVL